jgi:hypothetical protein
MDGREATAEAAVVARTVLSTSHEATCARLDGDEDAISGVVGLVAAGPQPYLVPADPGCFFSTGTALMCRVSVPDVGLVLCTGVTGPARTAADLPAVVRTLDDHRACLLGPVDAAALRVVPLQLFGISVALPGAEQASSLTPGDLAKASPDWLLARGRRLTEHLERDHAQDLVQLAVAHGVPDVATVTLSALTTRGARLVCLGADGVTTVEMVFDPPVDNPAQLWRRMSSAPVEG